MDYAIEILNIELYKWKAIYNQHELIFVKEPNNDSEVTMGLAKEKIESLETSIKTLKFNK